LDTGDSFGGGWFDPAYQDIGGMLGQNLTRDPSGIGYVEKSTLSGRGDSSESSVIARAAAMGIPGFNPSGYLQANPDVAQHPAFGLSSSRALDHYMEFGRYEGRDPKGTGFEPEQFDVPGYQSTLGRMGETVAQSEALGARVGFEGKELAELQRVDKAKAAKQGLGVGLLAVPTGFVGKLLGGGIIGYAWGKIQEGMQRSAVSKAVDEKMRAAGYTEQEIAHTKGIVENSSAGDFKALADVENDHNSGKINTETAATQLSQSGFTLLPGQDDFSKGSGDGLNANLSTEDKIKQLQYESLVSQTRYQQRLQRTKLGQMGYTLSDDGQSYVQTGQPMQDPGLEKLLRDEESKMIETSSRRGGLQWEQSTPGIQTKSAFETGANTLRYNAQQKGWQDLMGLVSQGNQTLNASYGALQPYQFQQGLAQQQTLQTNQLAAQNAINQQQMSASKSAGQAELYGTLGTALILGDYGSGSEGSVLGKLFS